MKSLILLSGLGVLTLLSEMFNFKRKIFPVVLLGLLGTIVISAMYWNTNKHYFNDMMFFDNYAVAFTCLISFIAFAWFLLSQNYFNEETNLTDHFALILFALVGAVIMVSYQNMSMLFLGIETLSLSLYVLAGSRKDDLYSNEAALKYFLMGAFATGFLLFGIALIYGITGSFNLQTIANYITLNSGNIPALFYTGVLLMMVGMAFKISAAPFHFWAPDVYQGSPLVITAFMATIIKTAAFAAFFRLFFTCFSTIESVWGNIIFVMAILTLAVGNITATYQESVKRMLAYSSIAHAGYMLLAILAMNKFSAGSILFYTAAYSVASITAFTVLSIIINKSNNEAIDAFNGLGKRNPFLAFAMTVAMLSLAGIPPMAGFFGKYYLFNAALQSGQTAIVLVAVLASLVGVYYYFKVIIAMYFKSGSDSSLVEVSFTHKLLLILTLVLIFAMGLMSDFVIRLL